MEMHESRFLHRAYSGKWAVTTLQNAWCSKISSPKGPQDAGR